MYVITEYVLQRLLTDFCYLKYCNFLGPKYRCYDSLNVVKNMPETHFNTTFTAIFSVHVRFACKAVSCASLITLRLVEHSIGKRSITQPPIQWVPEVFSPGVKLGRGVTLTTHPI
jgi:hypothetical protein